MYVAKKLIIEKFFQINFQRFNAYKNFNFGPKILKILPNYIQPSEKA